MNAMARTMAVQDKQGAIQGAAADQAEINLKHFAQVEAAGVVRDHAHRHEPRRVLPMTDVSNLQALQEITLTHAKTTPRKAPGPDGIAGDFFFRQPRPRTYGQLSFHVTWFDDCQAPPCLFEKSVVIGG